MTCSDCPATISTQSKSGRCRTCALRVTMSDPVIRARRVAAATASQRDPAKALTRSMAARRGLAKRMANPEYRETAKRIMLEVVRPKSTSAEAMARRDYKAVGKKLSQTRLAWCPPELIPEYQKLRRQKGMGAAAARAVMEKKIGERRSRTLTFEEKLAKVLAGATISTKYVPPVRQHDFSLTGGSLA